MLTDQFLILGAGFTGSRVAARLLARGLRVRATHRADLDVTQPGARDILLQIAEPGCVVLHSIPTLPDRADSRFLPALRGVAHRVVYLSTTAVYGAQTVVDEHTLPAPDGERAQLRLETEQAVQTGPWQSLVLRPAAIYGPGRGAHVALQEGRASLDPGYVSRIHVDDLARIAEAALLSGLTGAYPVADQEPCSSREITEYCAALLGLKVPESANQTRRSGRRVDGRATLAALGLNLLYPSYKEGIPASISLAVR